MTSTTAQNLSDALTDAVEVNLVKGLAYRIEQTKEAFAYFYGDAAAEVLNYENAENWYVKVSTDAASFVVMAHSDFDGADGEFFWIDFYRTMPTSAFARWFRAVKRSEAMAALEGKAV